MARHRRSDDRGDACRRRQSESERVPPMAGLDSRKRAKAGVSCEEGSKRSATQPQLCRQERCRRPQHRGSQLAVSTVEHRVGFRSGGQVGRSGSRSPSRRSQWHPSCDRTVRLCGSRASISVSGFPPDCDFALLVDTRGRSSEWLGTRHIIFVWPLRKDDICILIRVQVPLCSLASRDA